MKAPPADLQRTAEAVRDAMFPRDSAARFLGIELVEIAPGRAVTTLVVRPELTNGHLICHGGVIFTLADTAFAYACNSHNHNAVAAGCTIDFLAPAHVGDVLTATATESLVAGRTGIYDIQIRNQRDHAIATFRGRSHRIKGLVTDGLAEPPRHGTTEENGR